MTRLEIFILSELIRKASFEVNVQHTWFDELVQKCDLLSEKEKHDLQFVDGSYFNGQPCE